MKFIRIDIKGEWRGQEHISSFGCEAGEQFEEGISCYDLEDKADAIDKLRYYWTEIVMDNNPEDYEDKQITIFEGELVGMNAEMEDAAVCHQTVKEIEAKPFMEDIFNALEEHEDNVIEYDMDEEDADEIYYSKLLEIAKKYGI